MNWEIRTDKYTLLYIKYITNENLLYSSGNSAQCSNAQSFPKWEGNLKKQGIYVYVCVYIYIYRERELVHFAEQQKLTQQSKAIIPQ